MPRRRARRRISGVGETRRGLFYAPLGNLRDPDPLGPRALRGLCDLGAWLRRDARPKILAGGALVADGNVGRGAEVDKLRAADACSRALLAFIFGQISCVGGFLLRSGRSLAFFECRAGAVEGFADRVSRLGLLFRTRPRSPGNYAEQGQEGSESRQRPRKFSGAPSVHDVRNAAHAGSAWIRGDRPGIRQGRC